MAMTADSTSNHVTPRGSGFSGEGLSSPQKNFPSPWSQVVRGEPEPSPASAAVNHSQSASSSPPPPTTRSLPEPTDTGSPSKSDAAAALSSPPPVNPVVVESSDANNGNAARTKKPAWNKPSNGVVEVGPVMGAVSWPALSESTKPSPKSSSSDSSSSKIPADDDGSVSSNQVPVIPQLTQKVSKSNANRIMPTQQRSKRGGGGGPTQTRPTQPRPRPPPPPPPPPFPVFPMPPNNFGNLVAPMPDPSLREPQYRGINWDARSVGGFVSQSHPVNDQRNPSGRGNYGYRGDGNYHNSFSGRRDHDRGNYSNARDGHVQPQRGPPRGFVRSPPPNATSFVPQQPMRHFPNSMGYPELVFIPPVPMEAAALRGVTGMPPFIPTVPVLLPVPEPSLTALLIHQIDYYFSDANLVKDEYLKSNMDDQGWVPITLIASFPRVRSLTNNIRLILDTLRTSTVVEVQEDKVRRRDEWMKWIVTPSRVPTESSLSSPVGSSVDLLATSFQNITVEEGATNQRSLPGNANTHSEDAPGRNSSEGEATEDSNQN